VCGDKKNHMNQLKKCLKECWMNGISLNPETFAFCVDSCVFFKHC
jgi:hypothetical protein